MPTLLDSNVWLPLVWDGHSKHPVALSWVASQSEPLCFCRITHLALLRHLTHQSIMGNEALTNAKALALIQQLLASPSIRLLQEPVGTHDQLLQYGKSNTRSPQVWTDAYLASFAIAGNLRFATFDKGFKKFKNLNLEILT